MVYRFQSKLVDVFNQFERCVQQYQLFWDAMDELDDCVCVLEPDKPTRNATYRRIALGMP